MLAATAEGELSDSAGNEVSRGIVDGSWTFYKDNTGANRIKILPYVPGAINYVESQGEAVISGEFKGRIMAAYEYPGGAQRVSHVDTDTSRPSTKANWEKLVADKKI